MDLWIRSQNEEQLIKINKDITITDTKKYKKKLNPLNINVTDSEYDKIDGIDIIRDAVNIEGYILTTDKLLLGKYNSKERALKILDDIQSCMETNTLFDLYSRTGIYPNDFNKKWNYVKVFQMPKE